MRSVVAAIIGCCDGAWASVHSVVGPFRTHTEPQVGGGETPKAA